MKLLLTIVLSIISVQVFACRCFPPPMFKTLDDLKGYDVIALVKVDDLGLKANVDYLRRPTGDIKVTVIEQFKGERISLFTDLMFNSSCAMTLNVGEEWLFFGRINNGKVTVGVCDYNVVYRDALGIRDWVGFRGINEMAILRALFGHKPSGITNKIFYPDGSQEIQQNLKDGKLDGAT